MCAAARTPSGAVTDTFPLVFIDALFLRITKGCGLRGTGNRDRHRGTGMLIIALHVYTNTAHRTVCTDRMPSIGSDSATVRTYSPRRTSYSSEQSQTTRQEHRPQWSLCGMCRAGSLAAPVRRLCGPYAISPWLPTPTTNLS